MRIVYEPSQPRYLVVTLNQRTSVHGPLVGSDVERILSSHDSRELADRSAEELRYDYPGQRVVVIDMEA